MALSMMVFFKKLQKNPFVSQILEQVKKKNNLSNHSVVPNTSKIIEKTKKNITKCNCENEENLSWTNNDFLFEINVIKT